MIGSDVYILLNAADHNVRRFMAQAAALQDWTDRQLSVLRNTYPTWGIELARDGAGYVWWTARLRQLVTVEMVAAGIRQYVYAADAIALAATLAEQTSLVSWWQARSGHL
ncbi:hypothetical protein MF672_038675 [Actinomadura sp. ATCC 31491]|uniref:Uncharacterized protein n=1 Tax=Actinomadura luzonensis TaxID=2805427 RepID=A0ABT0G4Z5_9ACTN|nr:hypothetical protein [Actinomadura luzonensis]MCK2219679.1 hypothetical protein [Actinomadura luzonensis]